MGKATHPMRTKKKSKKRRKQRKLELQEILGVLHLSQNEAAEALDICLSTLKRQFSKLRNLHDELPDRWPVRPHVVKRNKLNAKLRRIIDKSHQILNKKDEPEKSEKQEFKPLVPGGSAFDPNLAMKDVTASGNQQEPVKHADFQGDIHDMDGSWNLPDARKLSDIAAFFLIDCNGDMIACNDMFFKMTKYSKEDCQEGFNICTKQKFMVQAFEPQFYVNILRRFLQSGQKFVEFTETCQDKNGEKTFQQIIFRRWKQYIWVMAYKVDNLASHITVNERKLNKYPQGEKASISPVVDHAITMNLLHASWGPTRFERATKT